MIEFSHSHCHQCDVALIGQEVGGMCANCLLELAVEPPADFRARANDMGEENADEIGVPMERAGCHIGRYRLLQEIGKGGFGVVWMAEQTTPLTRRVALKIIKPGMDTREVIARFGAERQALAMMDHPNIAMVFDAGATDHGRPFFVMELVKGIPITHFCDKNGLGTRDRLQLFGDVCAAIHHAHQKGIIHRDIKPCNVMITLIGERPVVKVIDFGIAKATMGRLTDQTIFTRFEQFIGTPAYMSPEQTAISELDIDARSDIYSLGILLYELLTGQPPFDAKSLGSLGYEEMRRIIREVEPVKPSSRLNCIDGQKRTSLANVRNITQQRIDRVVETDLDWIVMKAIDKERTRRYQTVNGLADDIVRHLSNEPVIARPPTTTYKFQKAVRRNKLALSAAATVFFLLILGIGASTWQAVRATRAEREQSQLRQEADLLRINEAKLRGEAETKATTFQANLLLSQGKFEEADQLVGELSPPLSQPTVEGAASLRALGEWHAAAGRWREAAARFNTAIQLNHFDIADVSTMDFLKYGSLLIELGEVDRYNQLRQAAIARFGDVQLMFVGERIIKASLLLPADDHLIKSLNPLVALQQDVDIIPPNRFRSEMAAWTTLSRALMEYRSGNPALAFEWCGRCLAFPPDSEVRAATAEIVLAMSLHQLQQTDLARSRLAQGREIIQSRFQKGLGPTEDIFGRWFDWLIARILLREATALVEGQPVGKEKPKPGDPIER